MEYLKEIEKNVKNNNEKYKLRIKGLVNNYEILKK